jgi:hypothetical protein
MLEEAPTHGTTDANWSDRRWGQQLHDYYGARPYWSRRRITRVAGCGVPASFSLPVRLALLYRDQFNGA